MAKKQVIDKVTKEIKTCLAEKKAVIGKEQTLKNLKLGKLEKVFLASNCPEEVKTDMQNYCKLSGAKAVVLKHPNDELGVICKKPFSISAIGVLKV